MMFLDIFLFIFYFATCILCLRIAKIEFSSNISITSMFVLPYLCICTFQEITCIFFDYFDIPSAEYWMINIIFIAFTFFVELFLTKISKKEVFKQMIFCSNKNYRTTKIFTLISTLIILYVVYSSIKMVGSIDLSMLFQEDFQDDFGESAGGNFYIRLLTMIFAVYFLGVCHSKFEFFLGCLCFIPHIIVNTKGILFIPIIATLVTRVLLGRITNLKKTFVIIATSGILIFMFSYLLENIIYQQNVDKERLEFIGEKMIVYIIAGVQEFSVNVRDSVEHNPMLTNITIAPINNLLAKFGLSTSISNVNNEFNRLIGILPHYGKAYSNVNGYIGTLYIFNGLLGGLLYHIVLICSVFFIKVKYCYLKRPFWLVLYSLVLSGFFLGWFEFYFMHTFWIYFILLTIMIDGIYILCKKLKI